MLGEVIYKYAIDDQFTMERKTTTYLLDIGLAHPNSFDSYSVVQLDPPEHFVSTPSEPNRLNWLAAVPYAPLVFDVILRVCK